MSTNILPKRWRYNAKKIFIIGNGRSTKKIIEYGFEKFIELLKKHNFKIICMNKILKFFEKENINNLPDCYVAGDVHVNGQMSTYIINFTDRFKKCYIGLDSHLLSNEEKQKKLRNILSKKQNVNIINHTATGHFSLHLANKMEADEIYLIGMDENYNFCNKYKENSLNMKIIPNVNDNYFFDYYIDEHETFSRVLSHRKKILEEIINKISETSLIFNLSNNSSLETPMGYLSFENFISNI